VHGPHPEDRFNFNPSIFHDPTIAKTVTMTLGLPPRERLLKLAELSCRIFSTTFNPTAARTGNRILRERLKGPTFLDYYPRRVVKIQDLKRGLPNCHFPDEDEKKRLGDVLRKKLRGKGPPKKKKEMTDKARKAKNIKAAKTEEPYVKAKL